MTSLRILKITGGIIIAGLLFVCADRAVDPYGNNTKDESQFKGTISGTVLGDNGFPVQGVSVTIDSAGFASNTDSTGYYRIPSVSAGTYSIVYHHPNYFDTTLAGRKITLVQDQDIVNINMIIRRNPARFPGTIAGVVRDSAGKGVSGVSVTVDSAGNTTVTDETGSYTIPGVIAGTHRLTFTKSGYFDTVLTGVALTMSQTVTGITVALRQVPSAFRGSISGKATDSASLPVSGLSITIDSAGFTTMTDTAGNYTIPDVIAGTHRLTFTKTGYYDTVLTGVVLAMGQSLTGINMTVRQIPAAFRGSISGKATDSASLPVSGLSVTIDSAGFTTMTDTAGNYTIPDVIAGTHRLTFTKTGYYDTVLTGVALAMGQSLTGINMTVRQIPSAFRGSISGLVTDTANRPISGVSVKVDSAGNSTTTGTDGVYTIPLVVAGAHNLTFTCTGYIDTVLPNIVLAISQNLAGVNIQMRMKADAFPGTVSGHVYAIGGMPIQSAVVTVLPAGNTSTSDATGAYIIAGVPAGTWSVQFQNASYYYDTLVPGVSVSHSQNVTGIDGYLRKKASAFPGAIRGIVVDSANRTPLFGAVVTSTPGGYVGTADSMGRYIIAGIPFGTYSFSSSVNHRSNTLSGVVVVENDTVDVDTLYAVRIDVLPKEVSGVLSGNTGIIYRIVATIKGDSIGAGSPILQQLTWLSGSNTYSGRISVPSAGSQWTSEVRVYDSASRIIGYQIQPFDKGAATVSMPLFNCENAKPIALARPDTTVSIKDTIILRGAAVDTFDMEGRRTSPDLPNIIKWEWAVGNSTVFNTTGKDTAIILPASQNLSYRCVLRVTDNDGTTGMDTVAIIVKRDAPRVSAGPDTFVSISDTVRLHGTASDTLGKIIVSYEWNINNTGFMKTTTGDTIIRAPAAVNSNYLCVLRATDNDGNQVTDTMKVTVLLCRPTVYAGKDTTVSVNDVIRLFGSGADTAGFTGRIVKYEWDIGATGVYRQSRADTVIYAPTTANANYRCVLRVTDDDNNMVTDEVKITVLLDAPAITAPNDTAVIGGFDTLRASSTQQYGTIVKWEWSVNGAAFRQCGGTAISCDTVITVPGVYVSKYPCIVRATDDDGNVVTMTMRVFLGKEWPALALNGITENADIWGPTLKVYAKGPTTSMEIGFLRNLNRPRAFRWSPTDNLWQSLGKPTIDSITFHLAVDFRQDGFLGTEPNIEPFFAYMGSSDSLRMWTSSLGSSWSAEDFPTISTNMCRDFSLAKTILGQTYVGWINMNDNVCVYQCYTGSSSSPTLTIAGGDTLAKTQDAKHINLALSASGTLWASLVTGTTSASHWTYVHKIVGGTWQHYGAFLTGDNGETAGGERDIDNAPITFDADTAYIAYVDASFSNYATVSRFNESISSWEPVGAAGSVSEGPVKNIVVAANAGTVYVAYLERSLNDNITVKSWDGTGWVTLGKRGLATSQSKSLSLAVFQGVPYLAYKEYVSGELRVVKLQ